MRVHCTDIFLAALPRGLRGLNAPLMNQYVEYVADFLLWRLGFPSLYGQKNPVSVASSVRWH